ncbi:gp57B conserved hypothetical protein [Aeromonas phage Aeh1]|uniref:Anti-CBASS protein Acb1 n=1 Tax=Aeromonas phage Aeh1 TaxID=2880362 RepID=Q76YP7_9CAUD|nr:RNA ligase [Aeromonas phage Aeh1]AAQ17849.1 gp57B conserved hypothetical protein [Aeromonas phage Aeh1]
MLKSFSEFTEATKQDTRGTYVAVRYKPRTAMAIVRRCREMGIPNLVPYDKMHTTLVYSRKYLPEFQASGKIDKVLQGVMIPDIFETQSGKRALVLKLTDPWFGARHKEIREKHGATHDYPDYHPHITASYDVGPDFVLPKSFTIDYKLCILEEYTEDLNFDWSP